MRRKGLERLAIGSWAAVALFLLLLHVVAPRMGLDNQSLLRRGISQLSQVWIVAGIVAWAIRPLFPLRRLVTSMHPVQRVLVGAIITMLFVAQYAPVADRYPFVRWSLYTVQSNSEDYLEFRMLAGGSPIGHVPFRQLVPTNASRAFMSRLGTLVTRVQEGDATARRKLEEILAAFIAELGDPNVDGVEVRECRVEEPTAEQPAKCEAIMTAAVGSD
jgi:hypothetical protein